MKCESIIHSNVTVHTKVLLATIKINFQLLIIRYYLRKVHFHLTSFIGTYTPIQSVTKTCNPFMSI